MTGPLLIVVFSLVACASAGRMRLQAESCEFDDVSVNASGSLSYFVPESSPGVPNCTSKLIPMCTQQVENTRLIGRSWFITQDKAFFGQSYNRWWFEPYNVRCPQGYYLYLKLQDIRMECVGQVEGVTITTSEFGTSTFCTQAEFEGTPYYNENRGVYLGSGTAKIDFCSDGADERYGFVLRGTCIHPAFTDVPGCVHYRFFRDWDPQFTNIILDDFDKVSVTVVPHKRSAEEKAQEMESIQALREQRVQESRAETAEILSLRRKIKRDRRQSQRTYFSYPNGTTVTYINSILMFNFPNGTSRAERVTCLSTGNDVFGTRNYRVNATRQSGDTKGGTSITFTGPGFADIFYSLSGTNAVLKWTPNPNSNELLKEDTLQIDIANRIYEYMYTSWIAPYPVISEILDPTKTKPYPLRGGEGDFSPNIRRFTQVGAIFTDILANSTCRRSTRLDVAPLINARIDHNLTRFCNFYMNACNPVLAAACREVMILDPFDNFPMMMGAGDR